jgi:Helix-turn-helix domain/RodZ C-terminal domain
MDNGVGRTLQAGRRRRRVDLAQVEATTKIRVRYLRALENEEWDVLPGEAYARGFIRTYADYLGLDGARLAAEHRGEIGAGRPGERGPRVEPAPIQANAPRRSRRMSPRVLGVVAALLVAVLVGVGLSREGGGGSAPAPADHPRHAGQRQEGDSGGPSRTPAAPKGLSLRLTATAEVWVCLLDSGGRPLVDGQVLEGGAEAGPFRSGSFTLSLGNGEVSMTVNGQQASIPATSSPVGYAIGAGGRMRELSEGERPTCT